MANREELRKLSKARLKAAKLLYDKEDFDCAVYLVGYVVEFALKAAICKRLNLGDYPDSGAHEKIFKTHHFDRLLTLSGMSDIISLSGPRKLWENWSELTQEWRPDVRYEPIGTYSQQEIERKFEALEERPHGFLTWIKRYRKW